jgi:hypothetical protein
MRAEISGSPRPVTRPMRALISWMPAISGYDSAIVHRKAKPN